MPRGEQLVFPVKCKESGCFRMTRIQSRLCKQCSRRKARVKKTA